MDLLSLLRKKANPQFCTAVIVAAGSSTRMEGIDKIFAPLGELPVLAHTLYAFQDSPAIDEIVVVTRRDLLEAAAELREEYGFHKVAKVVAGGETRLESVRAGLLEVSAQATLAAIHDGARPLVSGAVIRDAVERAAVTGAAAPALPVTDTIKRAGGGLTVETVDRAQLWAVQTPQVFDLGLIRAAVEKAVEDKVELTDDCAAVERLGMRVTLTAGSRENIKITTPFDLLLGQAILEARVREET